MVVIIIKISKPLREQNNVYKPSISTGWYSLKRFQSNYISLLSHRNLIVADSIHLMFITAFPSLNFLNIRFALFGEHNFLAGTVVFSSSNFLFRSVNRLCKFILFISFSSIFGREGGNQQSFSILFLCKEIHNRLKFQWFHHHPRKFLFHISAIIIKLQWKVILNWSLKANIYWFNNHIEHWNTEHWRLKFVLKIKFLLGTWFHTWKTFNSFHVKSIVVFRSKKPGVLQCFIQWILSNEQKVGTSKTKYFNV